jgi:hypothetical protein
VFCIPLIAMLRMVLRPMPEPDPSYQSSSPRPAIYLFWRTCLFNLLWLLTFYGLVAMDVTDDPHSKLDVLRGFSPIETFGLLIMFGRNGLLRRHTLLSILVCWRTQRLIRFKEMLLHVVKKGDPFYHAAVFLEALLFIELAVSMLDGVWPWVSGQSTSGGPLQVAAHLLAFGTAFVSWKYLKEANRIAAASLQYEIDKVLKAG